MKESLTEFKQIRAEQLDHALHQLFKVDSHTYPVFPIGRFRFQTPLLLAALDKTVRGMTEDIR